MSAPLPLKNILYEFTTVGNSVKVSALDPKSKIEISIVGPRTASSAHLQMVARRKLEYVIRKRFAD